MALNFEARLCLMAQPIINRTYLFRAVVGDRPQPELFDSYNLT
jgi:hypothetical protein